MRDDVISFSDLLRLHHAVRRHSIVLADKLSAEDQLVQSMPEASPTKWHLAHTTWFFEAVLLKPWLPGYTSLSSGFEYLFNSYYESLGPRQPRARRGLLSRPFLPEIHAYRRYVDDAIDHLFASVGTETLSSLAPLLMLGIHHEQQHQELILTDILHVLACNPLLSEYCSDTPLQPNFAVTSPIAWLPHLGGKVSLGHQGNGFAFDNESPAHEVLLRPYAIADRLTTNADYAAFIADGGYRRPEFWLSDGWAMVQTDQLQTPLYWFAGNDWRVRRQYPHAAATDWFAFDLSGLHPIDPSAPVSNLSFYEAAAFAEWAGARLPTEAEWEASYFLPAIQQMTGYVWQWTRSSYDPYPGFRPLPGIAAEYNGKFMVGQMVLRGSSFATPDGHARHTYRNFFPPSARWQFAGIRLARDV